MKGTGDYRIHRLRDQFSVYTDGRVLGGVLAFFLVGALVTLTWYYTWYLKDNLFFLFCGWKSFHTSLGEFWYFEWEPFKSLF